MSLQLAEARPAQWQDWARCSGVDKDVFFPDENDATRARIYCAVCPVWDKCLAAGRGEDGVWGGLTSAERERLGRLQRRLTADPRAPENIVDVRWLVRVGMTPERLASWLDVPVATILLLQGQKGPRGKRVRL